MSAKPYFSGSLKLRINRTCMFTPLPDDEILDWSKLNQIAEDLLKCI